MGFKLEKNQKLIEYHKESERSDDFYEVLKEYNLHKYLRKWSFETEEGYAERLEKTIVSKDYKTIIDSLQHMVLKKEPILENLDLIDFDDFDYDGNNLNVFLKIVIKNALLHGITFITFFDNFKFVNLKYTSLFDFKFERNILKEIKFLISEDEILHLFIGGYELFQKVDSDWKLIESKTNLLKEIPIVYVKLGNEKSKFLVRPALDDILELTNILLRKESSKISILNKAEKPVPVLITRDKTIKNVDTRSKGLVLDTGESFNWIEVKGDGIKFIVDDIKDLQKNISKSSYNMLGNSDLDSKTRIEAYGVENRNSSFLVSIIEELECKILKIIKYYYEAKEQGSFPNNASFKFKKNFDEIYTSVDQLTFMLELYKNGILTKKPILEKAKELNMLSSDFDIEKELQLIDEENIINK